MKGRISTAAPQILAYHIAKEEKIEVSDEEAHHELHHMCEHYHMTEEELMKEIGSLEVVKYDVRMKKALEVLKENN